MLDPDTHFLKKGCNLGCFRVVEKGCNLGCYF